MEPDEPIIQDVSDTAFWIAGYRAEESERPDAAFRDPFARRLAGERGMAMAQAFRYRAPMAFAMVVRTAAIDRLVEAAVARGVDTVINLGAGLDTRPYRMKLPASLRWVEVDFERVLDYKRARLEGEAPSCRVEQIAVDLSDDAARGALLARLGAECTRAAVLTEGVVGYLTSEQARALSRDLHAQPSFAYWIQDYARGLLKRIPGWQLAKKVRRSPIRFRVVEPHPFFALDGWRVDLDLHILDEADRLGRTMPPLFPWNHLSKVFPGTIRRLGNATFGYVMYAR
jgi:methyltransferase (TIGR00027 family)